jgi:hypothetical protein
MVDALLRGFRVAAIVAATTPTSCELRGAVVLTRPDVCHIDLCTVTLKSVPRR